MTDIAAPAPLDIGRVIQETFAVLSRHFVTFLVLGLVLVGIPRALFGVIQVGTLRSLASGGLSFGGPMLYWSILGGLVAVVTGAILQAAVISAAASDLNGRPVSVGESLRIGLRAFLPLIGLSILLGIAIWIGLILLIVPGVLLALAWCVAVPVYVIERPSVMECFGRSADLTRGNRLRIFGLFCLFIVAAFLVSLVLGLVLGILGAVTGGLALYFNAAIVSPVISAIIAALGATMSAVLYVELRRVKEGAGPSALSAVFD